MRTVRYLAVLLLVLCIYNEDIRGQEKAVHFTVPDGVLDTLDGAMMSPYVQTEHHTIWIHNPTADTMMYWASGGFSNNGGTFDLFFFDSIHATYTVILPHDSARIIGQYGTLSTSGTTVETISCQKWNDTEAPIHSEPVDAIGTTKFRDDAKVELFEDQFVFQTLLYYGEPLPPKESTIDVIYVNDQDSLVTIATVFCPRFSRYSISRLSHDLPMTLAQGESLAVEYTFTGADTPAFIEPVKNDSFYYDIAVIITDTTYPLASASFKGSPPKYNPLLSVQQSDRLLPARVRCYPNPATNEIVLESDDAGASSMIEILDAAGRVVLTFYDKRITADGQRLPIASLPAGAYMIRAGNTRTTFIKVP